MAQGESAGHGTDGTPATPRDGAPIEISALLYSTLRWLAGVVDKEKVAGLVGWVTLRGGATTLTYAAWAKRILGSFERVYWVPADSDEDSK